MIDYREFLLGKRIMAPAVGSEVAPEDVNPILFPFQRDLVRWSIRKGRASIFADCGLGKTFMQLEFARLTGEPTLVLAPLGVTSQTVKEAEKLGIEAAYARDQSEATKITVTNYERLDRFDASAFGTIVLDESSILKSINSKTRQALIRVFRGTRWRLCCTATPAPNDTAEIGNHAEFLGLQSRAEMLATFFVHNDRNWLLKGHARRPFYRWLASWAMTIRKPSDLGYPDDGFSLPPLEIIPVVVPTDWKPDGQLISTGLQGITQRVEVRRATADARVAAAACLIESEPGEQWLGWCGLNAESDALAAAIPGAENVQGSDSAERKAEALLGFAGGQVRTLVTKPKVAGFGMNFQGCARMIFVGIGDSYETYYQAIRRCWRFGQTRPVKAYIVLSEPEEAIYQNVLRKEADATRVAEELIANAAEYERAELATKVYDGLYEGTEKVRLPSWL